jgi:ATP adenylyltransferase
MTDRLWSPWRMEYILSDKDGERCVFCEKRADDHDEENLILLRGSRAFVILNRYPYNSGHLLVVPNTHVSSTEELEPDVLTELMLLTNMAVRLLRKVMSPDAFNIGINLGGAAGAGIEDHVHIHIVPRWVGDTNFMPVLGQTRVVPELLAETYAKLRDALVHEQRTGA